MDLAGWLEVLMSREEEEYQKKEDEEGGTWLWCSTTESMRRGIHVCSCHLFPAVQDLPNDRHNNNRMGRLYGIQRTY